MDFTVTDIYPFAASASAGKTTTVSFNVIDGDTVPRQASEAVSANPGEIKVLLRIGVDRNIVRSAWEIAQDPMVYSKIFRKMKTAALSEMAIFKDTLEAFLSESVKETAETKACHEILRSLP